MVQVDNMLQMKQMNFQETYQLSEASTFPLGPDEGFTFAYKIMNKNRTVLFDQTGYLNIEVQ